MPGKMLTSSAMKLFFILFSCLLLLYCTNARNSIGIPSLSPRFIVAEEDHDNCINSISSQLRANFESNSLRKLVALRRKGSQSHCPRPQDYKSGSLQIDIANLNKIIEVIPVTHVSTDLKSDEIVAVADVQAMISMEELVDALLPLGMIPAVVPEFKGITLGGSVQGLAAETTSFSFGFVHDAIAGFEVITGNGDILWCSRTSNTDLFHGLPGSFGSLGICTRVKVFCIKADPFVKITSVLHSSDKDCIGYMSLLQDRAIAPSPARMAASSLEKNVHFMEGIAYGPSEFASIIGSFVDREEYEKLSQTMPTRRCNGWGNRWFFNQIKSQFHSSNPIQKLVQRLSPPSGVDANPPLATCLMPTKDYLFRHDQGSFWMASYRIPQCIGRFLGPLLDSSSMFRLADALPWAFPKQIIALQDFMVPREQVVSFVRSVEAMLDLWPLWLLPMRNVRWRQPAQQPNLFAIPLGTNDQMCNVGVYGIPRKRYHFEEANKALERALLAHGGRKVYYSHCFYDRDVFYRDLHDGKRYFELRKKYHAEGVFPEIYDKVVTKKGRL